jgi:hypothetical protein
MFHTAQCTFTSNPSRYLVTSIQLNFCFVDTAHTATSTLRFQSFTQPIIYTFPATISLTHQILFIAPVSTCMMITLHPQLTPFTI